MDLKQINQCNASSEAINLLVKENGEPNSLHIWGLIMKYVVLMIPCIGWCECGKCGNDKRKKKLLELLLVCRTFNNLPELREFFRPISSFNGHSMRFKTANIASWSLYKYGVIGEFRFKTLMSVKTRLGVSPSNRIYGITWMKDNNNFTGYCRWVYDKWLPIYFFARVTHLIDISGNILSDLNIPMFSYKNDLRPNTSKFIYQKFKRKIRWVKTQIGDTKLLNIKGKYTVLVLGSPFNLFEVDNIDYLTSKKVEPIAKISGPNICYLVYRIQSLRRYRIFFKSDIPGRLPIYFRTNTL